MVLTAYNNALLCLVIYWICQGRDEFAFFPEDLLIFLLVMTSSRIIYEWLDSFCLQEFWQWVRICVSCKFRGGTIDC